MQFDDYIKAHHHSNNHMDALKQDKVCGCFYCLRIFNPIQIEEWIVDDNPCDKTGTAICPFCGVDSIIGESSGYTITQSFLRGMKKCWFDE
ncbi:MAG: cytoplasmic protein [Ruminococcaceae bacterium]|nr:cytoplasmic protein [Oscillospiraceae bacterium]